MGQDTLFSTKSTLRIGGNVLPLDPPLIMGILNVTPDSFSDGGALKSERDVIEKAGIMLDEGASILDIGGYSTRPGAAEISVRDELGRVIPAIRAIRREMPEAIISVDTFRSVVAKEAVDTGANMINDVSGGSLDKEMFNTVAHMKVPYILMHMKGTPQTMKSLAEYDHMLAEILRYFNEKVSHLRSIGVEEIIIDPGFGFAKNISQNYYLLKNMGYFRSLGLPLLIGISRKSMIFRLLNMEPSEAVNGTTVLNTHAIVNGASILRVHDVREAMECIRLSEELKNAKL